MTKMLVAGNTVAVIGYSYVRGGTELGLFNIDEAGQLSSATAQPTICALVTTTRRAITPVG